MVELVLLLENIGTYTQTRFAVKIERPNNDIIIFAADSYTATRYDISKNKCFMKTEVMLPREEMEKIAKNTEDPADATLVISSTIFEYINETLVDSFHGKIGDDASMQSITLQEWQLDPSLMKHLKAISTIGSRHIVDPGRYKKSLMTTRRRQSTIICRKPSDPDEDDAYESIFDIPNTGGSAITDERYCAKTDDLFSVFNLVGIERSRYELHTIPSE